MTHPDVFKAMMMNAFPTSRPLDGKGADLSTLDKYEDWMIGFLATLENHIALEKNRARADAYHHSATLVQH